MAGFRPPHRRVVAPRLHAQRLLLDRAALHVRDDGVAEGPERPEVGEAADLGRPARAVRLAVHAVPRDLPIAPELAPVSTKHGVDVYDVDIKEGVAEILPGYETPIYGYEGVYPGPTIRARKGRPAIVRQHNKLSFDTNVHLHGGYVPAAHDGHPMDVIAPGAGFDYTYPNEQDAAFLWYHDHAHGRTARTLYYGLVGTYLLQDDREEELELPQGEYDVPLVLADHAFNKDGSFRYAENVDLGFRGDTMLVNGAVVTADGGAAPALPAALPQRVQRALLRAQARQRPPDAADRHRRRPARDAPVARTSFPLHPAERIEVLIDFRAFKPGSEIVLQNVAADAGTTKSVMRFDVVDGGGAEEARMPRGRMRTLEKLPRPNATHRWDLSLLTQSGVQWQIANRGFDPNRIDVSPRLGTRSCGSGTTRPTACTRCTCTGCSSASSSAARGSSIRVSGGGRTPSACSRARTVTVQPWFVPYAGRYVFHCHSLEHGDKAMMLQLEVTK